MTNLLTALKQLRESGPKDRYAGICSPHYSGDLSFPVPSPDVFTDAYFDNLYDLWD